MFLVKAEKVTRQSIAAYKTVTDTRGELMNIVIKIIEGEKIINYESLADSQKKEYGQRLNEQALKALGYVKKD